MWLLAATPFAFGSLWHWGFLNFLLGTGLFLGALALVVRASEKPSRGNAIALGAMSIVLFFTHFHADHVDGLPGVALRDCGDLAHAVAAARAAARPGDVVLLSPACASYDQFENFEARGEAFGELART